VLYATRLSVTSAPNLTLMIKRMAREKTFVGLDRVQWAIISEHGSL